MALSSSEDSAPGDRSAGNSALKPLHGQLHFKPGEKRSWSVDDAIEHIGVGRFHHLLTCLVGVAFASDAVEVGLLSYLQVELQRDWHLSAAAAASITSAVFAGQFIGGASNHPRVAFRILLEFRVFSTLFVSSSSFIERYRRGKALG